MVKQYPHTVTYTVFSTSTRVSGDWQPPSPSTSSELGRYEPNSSGIFLRADDGQELSYSGIVYLPAGGLVKEGTQVSVKDEANNVLATGTVKRFSAGQLNRRIWL